MRAWYFFTFCCILIFSCEQPAPQKQAVVMPKDHAMLKKTPEIEGYYYRCGEMVQVVNYLRCLGKEKCVAALRQYFERDDESDAKILVLCRLLFVNPKGWDPPILGNPVPVPVSNEDAIKKFPLFPIALSNNVPFLLIQGYNLGGAAESPAECLKICEGLSLIKKDYSLTGYEKAAKALTQSESFLKLYDKKDRPQMVKMILHQAGEPEKDAK